MSPLVVGIIGVVAVLLLLFFKMPVGLVLALVGFAGLSYLHSVEAASVILTNKIYETATDFTYTVLPLFVLMGEIAANSGISDRIFATAYKWFGHVPAGLAVATMAGCAGFSAICGSSVATSVTMCKVAFPEMEKYNYKPELSAGSVSIGGTLGILIPPSLPFILYAVLTGESIGKLFIAGIVPGIILTLLYIAVILIWSQLDSNLGPRGPVVGIREKLASLSGTGETLALFCLVMGGMFVGFFTPTEAGAVGAAGAILIASARRMLSWKQFLRSLSGTVRTTSMVMLLMVGAMVFCVFVAMSRLPAELAGWIAGLPLPPLAILIVIIVGYLILGCIVDTLVMILVTIPIYFPLVLALGFDPIWFGVIVIVTMEIGLITPPVGLNVWVIAGMLKHIPMWTIFKGVSVLLIGDLILVTLLVAFPQIALFLPSIMK